MECYGERVKVTLGKDRIATVYLLEDAAPKGMLGKRDAPEPESDEEHDGDQGSSTQAPCTSPPP